MNKEDRRVLRTRRLLKQALVDLTNERTFETITIRDITDRADIGYATFFRHYDGKDELMLEIFTGIIAEFESLPNTHGEDYFEREGFLIFKHVAENSAFYRSVFDSMPFYRRFREYVREMVQQHLEVNVHKVPSLSMPVEVAAQHMVSSLLGLIDWWLSEEQPYAVDQMALIYQRLIIQATWHALGEGNTMVLP